jgi:hypothetical protein
MSESDGPDNGTSERPSEGTVFNPQTGFPVAPGGEQGPTQPPVPPPPAPYGQPQYQPYPQQPYPQQPYPQQPYVPGQPYPAGQQFTGFPNYGVQDLPQANTAFILGLVSVVGGFFCVLPILAAPFAWAIGAKARRTIRESNGQYGGEGKATTGFILGIVGTVLMILGVIALVVVIVAIANSDPTIYDDFGTTT